MPKRTRVRARARRPIETTPRAEGASERGQRRAARWTFTGPVRATDSASPVLERAAAAERGYVMSDVRRLALVVAVMLALLVASGFAVSTLLR